MKAYWGSKCSVCLKIRTGTGKYVVLRIIMEGEEVEEINKRQREIFSTDSTPAKKAVYIKQA